MNAFEDVIGYDSLKQELTEILDIIHNPQIYRELGVLCPKGILLYGKPGVGKTLIADSFIAASGREAIICRKNAAQQSFIDSITESFERARDCAPSIILLDDMDKFANDDEKHKDSEAFVTIQSCIDLVKSDDVLVLATANNIDKLPDSLIRTGRFDRKIHVLQPTGEDAKAIIRHYLAGKDLGSQVDIDAVANLFGGHEASTLESAINQAGILAGYRRSAKIEMDDLIKSYLMVAHDIPKECLASSESSDLYVNDGSMDVFWHEAGHLVVYELLDPGSVSIAIAVGSDDYEHGFVRGKFSASNELDKRKKRIMSALGSAAAMDIAFGRVDPGAGEDIKNALVTITDISEDLGGFAGLSLSSIWRTSSELQERREVANSAIAELFFQEAKELLCQNRLFLEAVVCALAERSVLTAKDIAEIRASIEGDEQMNVKAA